jgi:hypothetical protein
MATTSYLCSVDVLCAVSVATYPDMTGPTRQQKTLPGFGEGLAVGAYQLPFRALICQMPLWLRQPGLASGAGLALTLGA